MKKLLIIGSLIPLLLCGCATQVPATKLDMPGRFSFQSPKDVQATNIVATINKDGTISVNIGSITSKNNPDVLAIIAQQNAQMTAQIVDLLKTLGPQIAGAAAKAAVP